MSYNDLTRRAFTSSTLGLLGASALGGMARAAVTLPTSPVTLNIVDVAGNLALTQGAIDKYKATKPNLVSKITYSAATAPELPAKLRAEQNAKRVDIDLVLTGTDALSAGIEQQIWMDLLPTYSANLPKLNDIYLPGAKNMQTLAQNQGVIVTYYPSGPLLEYAPDRVKQVPTTAEELMAYTKQNPNKFMYARPANSGPGRTFIMGLPYILGDSDPKDPNKGWDKTWAYLKALGENIEYYPSGTGALMKELGDGTRDMVASTTGWDINPRVLGIVPKEIKIGAIKGFHWVTDAHYMCVPKGLADEKVAVLLDLMSFLLQPAQQAFAYDKGYFYPGPAVKDVPISMAPAESQQAIKDFGRPEYDALIANNPLELPLAAQGLVAAFKRWDSDVGGAKMK